MDQLDQAPASCPRGSAHAPTGHTRHLQDTRRADRLRLDRLGYSANSHHQLRGLAERLPPAASFWAWLLELLPLTLQAMLAGLAALISAWALPPGGLVWRLPLELTHQFSSIGQAHAAMVHLSDAALALIVALVGLGYVLGPAAVSRPVSRSCPRARLPHGWQWPP